MYQKYILRISEGSLQKILEELNRIVINSGIEGQKKGFLKKLLFVR